MRRIVALLMFFLLLAFGSCIKEQNVFVPNPGQVVGPDSIWYQTINASMPVIALRNSLSIAPDIDSIQNQTGGNINSPAGLQCSFEPNSFVDDSGNVVSGGVVINTNLLIHKGDFIRMSNPTNSGGAILISAGAFYLNAVKNNKPLNLASNKKITLYYTAFNTNPKLFLYHGDTSNIEKYNWIQNTDTANALNRILLYSNKNLVVTNHLGWLNCMYPLDTTTTPCTNIAVTLPPTFTNFNTGVYLVFSDINAVMGIYSDQNSKTFLSGRIPSGKSVTIVTITKEGNFYYLGTQSLVTAVPPQGTPPPSGVNMYQKINIVPVKQTLDSINQFLSGL